MEQKFGKIKMRRITLVICTALGLIWASALLMAADAQAYTNCPCTTCGGATCQCCANNNPYVTALPFTIFVSPNCAGPGVAYPTLPNSAFVLPNTLPGTAQASSVLQSTVGSSCCAGVCNNTVAWGCTTGTETGGYYSGGYDYWYCACTGFTTSPLCSYCVPVNGSCGTTAYSCTAGTEVSEPTSGYYEYWYCDGICGGSTPAECSYHW